MLQSASIYTPRLKGLVLPSLLFLLALISYANSFPGAFIVDDVPIVQTNPLVQQLDMVKIFTSDYWGEAASSGLYRPLTILSLAVNRLIFGPHAWGYHLVNVVLHAAVTVLLFCFALELRVHLIAAAAAAALFAVHPIHTEVVNVMVGRSELLAAGFALLSLVWGQRLGRRNAILAAGFFLAAILSKEHVIVVLVLLPLAHWFQGLFREGRWRRFIAHYALYGGVTLFWWCARGWLVDRADKVEAYDPLFVPLAEFSWDGRIASALKIQGLYLQRLLLPWNLRGVYARSSVEPLYESILSLDAMLWVVFWGGVVALAWYGWRRRSLWALVLLFYLISILPTSNLLFVTGVTMAERLCYFPSLWFCLGLAVLIQKLPEDFSRKWGVVFLALLGVTLLTMLSLRNPAFHSEKVLFQTDVEAEPQNELAWLFLAGGYQRVRDWQSAETIYAGLLARFPESAGIMDLYARLLLETNRAQQALPIALKAERAGPIHQTSARLTLARVYLALGDYQRALSTLELIKESSVTRLSLYWQTRGEAEEAVGDLPAAVESYRQQALWGKGLSGDGQKRMAGILIRLEQLDEAEKILLEALKRGEDASLRNSLGTLLAKQGRFAEAQQQFRRAIELQPDNPYYRANLTRSQAAAR